MSSDKLPTRARLLEAADRLFYQRDINTVGVNEIVEVAGVAKTSLYLHFPSKNDLVAAYLEGRYDDYVARWRQIAARTEAQGPEARLDAVFDRLAEFAQAQSYNGCPFFRAAVEINDPEHPAWRWVRSYRNFLKEELLGRIAAAYVPDDPAWLAGELVMLYYAALAQSFVDRDPMAVERARDAAHACAQVARDRVPVTRAAGRG